MPVVMGSQRRMISVAEPADFIYITPGIYTLTVPAGVTSIGAIAVGAGANGSNTRGGGGGAMSFRSSYAVSPGDVLSIEVCAPGATPTLTTSGVGTASIKKGTTAAFLYAMGGNAAIAGTIQTGLSGGADSSTGAGGAGQTGSSASFQKGTGGGGAGSGGYTFNGNPSTAGDGGGSSTTPITANRSGLAGSGGAAGGEVNAAVSPAVRDGGGGGGIGIFGQGADGVALGGSLGRGGQGGSPYTLVVGSTTYNFGTNGVSAGTSTHIRPDGGFPGGGGGGSYDGVGFAGLGGGGVVRIFWGGGRSFPTNAGPSTNVTVF